jgi:hypothetical protein
MTESTPTKMTFRVHFHDGTSLDIVAANSLIAEKDARKSRPGAYVKKIKLVREKANA